MAHSTLTSDHSYSTQAVYALTKGSANWVRMLSSENRPPSPYIAGTIASAIAVAPTDPRQVFVGTSETIFRSGDGGNTWSDASSYQPNEQQPSL